MKRNWLLVLGIISLGVIITYRAWAIPMTHDEASTWLSYKHINVWSCLTNYACWTSANNHWLNTVLFQWSSWIGGDTPLAIRFPNVLAGFGYFICASLICSRYLSGKIIQITGFLLLFCHVYLLDFFSLARGYGLMACGLIWAIYFLLRYLENYSSRWLLFSLFSFFLACLANFTSLLPFSAAFVSWFAWIVSFRKNQFLLRHGIYWLLTAAVLWFLLRYPIKMVSGMGDFQFGAENLCAMSLDLIRNLLYGNLYFDMNILTWIFWVIILLLSVITGVAFFSKRYRFRHQVLFLSILFISTIAIILLQNYLLGNKAPEGRRAIFIIPLIFSVLALGLDLIKGKWVRSSIGIILSTVLILHFVSVLPFKSCREWYYDAYYPELFSTILPQGTSSDSISLGSSWIFYPALRFYQETTPLPISGLTYERPLKIDSLQHYYYVEIQDSTGMSAKGFLPMKSIGPFWLFQNIRSKED